MPDAAEYAQYMQAGECGNCGAKRAKGSMHYCARCLTAHRKYQRGAMRDKRQNDDNFRRAENRKQRARMKALRAKRKSAIVAIADAIADARQTLKSLGYFKRIGRNGGLARAKALSPRVRQILAIRAARTRWKKPKAKAQEVTVAQ